jgi:hypothetical protein
MIVSIAMAALAFSKPPTRATYWRTSRKRSAALNLATVFAALEGGMGVSKRAAIEDCFPAGAVVPLSLPIG